MVFPSGKTRTAALNRKTSAVIKQVKQCMDFPSLKKTSWDRLQDAQCVQVFIAGKALPIGHKQKDNCSN
jgi:hypothetical protein